MERLAALQGSGKMAALQQQLETRAKKAVRRPSAAAFLTRAIRDRVFYFDPSFVLTEDLRDEEGHVFQHAGTRISPLKMVSLSKPLLFFDSGDPLQQTWAQEIDRRYQGKTKLILVNGDVVQQTAQWKRTIYVDQQGVLVKKFAIEHVPALVEQAGEMLKIREIALTSGEDTHGQPKQ